MTYQLGKIEIEPQQAFNSAKSDITESIVFRSCYHR